MTGVPKLNKSHVGETTTNMPGPEAIQVTIRRIAANNELTKRSDGNKESVAPAPPAPSNKKRVGDVKAPVEPKTDGNRLVAEGVPPFAKESLSGDGWTRASAKAREMFAAKK